MYISIVIPVLSEEKSLETTLEKIQAAMLKAKKLYEVIFVDDGSRDSSLEILKGLEKKNKEVRVFSFRRNFGKSPALMLGFSKARGDYIATLDADLQDDPEDIIELLKVLEEKNLDLVNGWRRERKDSGFKIIASRLFNRFVAIVFKLPIHDINCPIKVYRREVTSDLQLYGGLHRFIPLLAHEMGYKIAEKKVMNYKRAYGESKFGGSKVIRDLPDLFTIYFLTKYSGRPLHFFGRLGLVPTTIGGIVLFYLFALRLSGESIGTRPLLIFGVLLFLFGIQIVLTGLIADLIVNINAGKNEQYSLKYESKD